MKKKTIKIIIAIIALVLICWVYQLITAHKTLDDTFVFLENLKQETQIDFSEIKDFELKWITETDLETIIYGKGFQVVGIPKEEFNNVLSFLENNGFKADINNIADGDSSWLRGYIKDKDICIVIERLTVYEETEDQQTLLDPGKRDIFIRCGELE